MESAKSPLSLPGSLNVYLTTLRTLGRLLLVKHWLLSPIFVFVVTVLDHPGAAFA